MVMLRRSELEALSKPELVDLCLALQETVQRLEAVVAQQQATITRLETRVAELERRLAQDSQTSHRPPSSDGLRKKTVSSRESSGKRSGGQPGHPGTTLRMVEQPDRLEQHAPERCPGCGAALAGVPGVVGNRRQVIELVAKLTEVIEHQVMDVACPECQTCVRGSFPAGVEQPIQYGAGPKGVMVYLQTYQLLPYERAGELLADVLGLDPSEGTLDQARQDCAAELVEVETAIKAAISQAAVAGFDETGVRIAGKLNWLHTAGTNDLTYYHTHPQRGPTAFEAIDILPNYQGTAVHDGLASYFRYDCRHGLCNSHHLRELKAIAQEPGQDWTSQMRGLLCQIKQAVDQARLAGALALTEPEIADFSRQYDKLVVAGRRANPIDLRQLHGRRLKRTPAQNLLIRLDEHRGAVLLFMHDFRVPFDNNQSERDLRMTKVKQKVSGCFRSPTGAADFCRIRGYISTLRKQGLPILPALQATFRGAPVVPELG